MALEILSTEWRGLGDHHLAATIRNTDACVVDFKFKARGSACAAISVKPSHGTLFPGDVVTIEISITPGMGVSFDTAMPTVCYKSEFEHSWILERINVPSRSARASPDAVDPTPKMLRGSSLQHPPVDGHTALSQPHSLGSVAAAVLTVPTSATTSCGGAAVPTGSHVTPTLVTKWAEYTKLVQDLRAYFEKGVKVKRLGMGASTAPAITKVLQLTKSKGVDVLRLSKAGTEASCDLDIKVSAVSRVVLGKPCATAASSGVDLRAICIDVRNAASLHLRFTTSDDFEGAIALLALVPHLNGKIEWAVPQPQSSAAANAMPLAEAQWIAKTGLAAARFVTVRDACLQSEHGSAWTPLDLVDRFGLSLFHAITISRLLPLSRPDDMIALHALVHV